MAFCSNCGAILNVGDRFCSNCGAQTGMVAGTSVTGGLTGGNYRVALISCGTCRTSYADDLLEDILGYTNADAKALVASVPVIIAQNLSADQAICISRALTEYGMQVTILDARGNAVVDNSYSTSVFDATGNYVSNVATTLALLSVTNRVARATRWMDYRPGLSLFGLPLLRRPAPPVHRRRPMMCHHHPAPAPMHHHHPAPPPPPVHHHPAPAPAPAPRLGGARGPAAPAPSRGPAAPAPSRGPAAPSRGPMGGGFGGASRGPGGPGGKGPGGRGPGR
ncbi:MAG: zinc ribbon domain-containing protein [Clostridia bacterium]|nr:zinc ribbon domain-containing protein [Clostridia bacterium]